MPNPDRPKVGEADPETRRKKLREILDTPTGANGVAAKKDPETMLDAVSKGVEEASESDTLPNGQKRKVKSAPPAKKDLKKRFGEKGQTEDEIMGDQ